MTKPYSFPKWQDGNLDKKKKIIGSKSLKQNNTWKQLSEFNLSLLVLMYLKVDLTEFKYIYSF